MSTLAHESTRRLVDLLRSEHAALGEFLVALADFDRRRLWEPLGHTGLFWFLHRELGLSKGAAHYRKVAAGLVQRFPEVVEPLRDGRLCITSVVELARVMTEENRAEVLTRFFHRSKAEARAVAVELRPGAAPRREVVTLVHLDEPEGRAAPTSTPTPTARPAVEPLTADLRRLHVTVSRRFLDKLEAAREALSHARPGAGAEEVLEAGLDLLLARQASRRGLVERPRARRERPEPKPPKTRRSSALAEPRPAPRAAIPAEVRREVWARDQGRCTWPLAGGGTCGSTHRLELDHVVPHARGGPATVANLRVLCRFHNDLAARQLLGEEWMAWRRAGEGRPREGAVPPPFTAPAPPGPPPCAGG